MSVPCIAEWKPSISKKRIRIRHGLRIIVVAGCMAFQLTAAMAGPDSPCQNLWHGLSAHVCTGPTPVFTVKMPVPHSNWVFFVDRGFSNGQSVSEAVDRVSAEISHRTRWRRETRGNHARLGGAVVTPRDLTPNAAYVQHVLATGAQKRTVSRWLNAVSVRATDAQIAAIAALPEVRAIQPVRGGRRIEPFPQPAPPPSDATVSDLDIDPHGLHPFYGRAFDQLSLINLTTLHDEGFTGQGVIIGVLDTGFARTHEAFTDLSHPIEIVAEWDFINDDPETGPEPGDPVIPVPGGEMHQHSHGTFILGVMGAYKVGELVGGAYDASFILCKTEDIADEQPIEEDYYVAGLEFIEINGGDVATSSLGYDDWYTWSDMDGQTAVTTIAVNIATDLGLICCTAAGNGGRDADEPTLNAPGDAFDVITVGAVTPSAQLTDFSSGGPTFDGRIKPEVLAQGESCSSVSDVVDDEYDNNLDGTSLSTPMAASAVACLLQKHPTWTIEQMRTALFETALYYQIHGVPDPQSAQGYGLIDAAFAGQAVFCIDTLTSDAIEPFALVLVDPSAFAVSFPGCDTSFADANDDGFIDGRDVRAFVDTLLGQ